MRRREAAKTRAGPWGATWVAVAAGWAQREKQRARLPGAGARRAAPRRPHRAAAGPRGRFDRAPAPTCSASSSIAAPGWRPAAARGGAATKPRRGELVGATRASPRARPRAAASRCAALEPAARTRMVAWGVAGGVYKPGRGLAAFQADLRRARSPFLKSRTFEGCVLLHMQSRKGGAYAVRPWAQELHPRHCHPRCVVLRTPGPSVVARFVSVHSLAAFSSPMRLPGSP